MPRGVSLYDEARLQGRLWTPNVLQPALWLDAADQSTITIATGVSEWRDKSGNGRHAVQASGTAQPAYSTTAFQGLPGITFDGVNDAMNISTALAQGNQTHGVYWVARMIGNGSGPDAYRSFLAVLPSANQDIGALLYTNPARKAASYPYFGQPNSFFFDAGPDVPLNTSFIHAFQSNTTGWGVWQNGSLLGTTAGIATPNANNAGYILGGHSPVYPRFSNIVFAEVIGIPNATAWTRTLWEGYVAWRWNLRDSIPASHPFRNRPPLIGG